MATDHYELLGVDRDAAPDEIRSAYRKLAAKYHPDRHPGNADFEKRFKAISTAYSILSDTENRRKYDLFRHAERAGWKKDAEAADVEVARDEPSYSYPIADVSLELQLSRHEMENGCLKSVAVARSRQCPDCKGSGRLRGFAQQRCMMCGGAGCQNCGGRGKAAADTCNRCWGRGDSKEQTRLVVTVPPRTQRSSRQRFLASGILWDRFAGMFYVDAFVKLR